MVMGGISDHNEAMRRAHKLLKTALAASFGPTCMASRRKQSTWLLAVPRLPADTSEVETRATLAAAMVTHVAAWISPLLLSQAYRHVTTD